MMANANPNAGWYQDPRDSSQVRWWDGNQWTQNIQAMPVATPEPTVEQSTDPWAAASQPSVAPQEAAPEQPQWQQPAEQPQWQQPAEAQWGADQQNAGWGQQPAQPEQPDWGQPDQWGQQPAQSEQPQWGQQPAQPEWGQPDQWGQQPAQPEQPQWGQPDQWGQQPAQPEQPQWGQQPAQPEQPQWGQQPVQPEQPQWGQQPAQPEQPQWGQQAAQPEQPQWGQQQPPGGGWQQSAPGGWGSNVPPSPVPQGLAPGSPMGQTNVFPTAETVDPITGMPVSSGGGSGSSRDTKRLAALVVGALLVGLLIIGLLWFFLFRGSSNGTSGTSTGPVEVTATYTGTVDPACADLGAALTADGLSETVVQRLNDVAIAKDLEENQAYFKQLDKDIAPIMDQYQSACIAAVSAGNAPEFYRTFVETFQASVTDGATVATSALAGGGQVPAQDAERLRAEASKLQASANAVMAISGTPSPSPTTPTAPSMSPTPTSTSTP